ncbi:MAG: hypothetical protein ACRD2N_02785 [Vicinamibacterales bacterium]
MRVDTRLATALGCLALFLCCVIPVLAQQSASVIKKKDGKVVEGAIAGLLVLKDLTKSTESGKINYSVTYYLINGRWVESITEDGVKLATTEVGTCTVAQEVPPTDLDILATCADISGGNPLAMAFSKDGGVVARMGLRLTRPPTYGHPLLGEFRKVNNETRLIGALEVTTATGTVTVRVADIVAFKPRAGN